MSRSILKDKFMRSRYVGRSFKESHWNDPIHNPHRQDEMPKNTPSRLIQIHCPWVKVEWLQSSSTFRGHACPKDGHRQVSGLVRASLKRETQKLITEQISTLEEEP